MRVGWLGQRGGWCICEAQYGELSAPRGLLGSDAGGAAGRCVRFLVSDPRLMRCGETGGHEVANEVNLLDGAELQGPLEQLKAERTAVTHTRLARADPALAAHQRPELDERQP